MTRKLFFTQAMITFSFILFFGSFIHADELDSRPVGPWGVFFAPHMENGTKAPDFLSQQDNWPRVVQMIAIADHYDAKVTLLFNPKWAEYILMDPLREDSVKQWQRHGHEVGLHYHGVTHVDWCGYTNRKDAVYVDSPYYRGSVADMMDLMNALTPAKPIVSACIGPDMGTDKYPLSIHSVPVAPRFIDEIDFPDEIIYDIDGIFDGRTRPILFEFNRRPRIHLRHGLARSKADVEDRIEEIATADPDEIIGLVTHASDYDPHLLHEIFRYLSDRDIQVQTVRDIMENYPRPLPME